MAGSRERRPDPSGSPGDAPVAGGLPSFNFFSGLVGGPGSGDVGTAGQGGCAQASWLARATFDEYDERGFNQAGIHSETGSRYDLSGYDVFGYDVHGFNARGVHRATGTPFGPDGFDRQGVDRDGYDRSGRDADGYDRDGYDPWGLDR